MAVWNFVSAHIERRLRYGRLLPSALTFVSIILAVLMTGLPERALGQTATEKEEPIIDWQERLTVEERLTAFGDNLMGDSIDPHIGSLTFEHMDVSLPGNNGLDVSIRRRLSQGYRYDTGIDVEFGNWELVVPKITAMTLSNFGWAGNRCSGSLAENFPDYIQPRRQGEEKILLGVDYHNGITVTIPGLGRKTMRKGRTEQFPTDAKAVTVDDWYFTCITASDGKEGFVGHAPNGDKYYFDRFFMRQAKELATVRQNSNSAYGRDIASLAASRVEDKNGNWVEYNYQNDRLQSITSSDGRTIELSYQNGLISRVSANGRHWDYDYRDTDFTLRNWDANSHPQFGSDNKIQVLSKVTRPDQLSWEFDLDGMLAEASPPGILPCPTSNEILTIKHPHGGVGTFVLDDLRHRRAHKILQYTPSACALALQEPLATNITTDMQIPEVQRYTEVLSMRTMSVVSKTLSYGDTDRVWTFSYEQGAVCDVAGIPCETVAGTGGHYTEESVATQSAFASEGPYYSDRVYEDAGADPLDYTNWTKVTQPDGTTIKYYHLWDYESLFGGKQIQQEISFGNIVLDKSVTTHMQPWRGNLSGSLYSDVPIHVAKTEQYRDGDIYTTEMAYNIDPAASDYSFGNPVSTRAYTSFTRSQADMPDRVTDTTYQHNKDKWILGLPRRVTVNGRRINDYDYDDFGRKIRQKLYGHLQASFTYNDDGTMNSAADALGRSYQAGNWKRGTPQLITRPDGTTESQVIDDNGWVTSSTDAMGRTDRYSYDIMGRVTQIDPHGSWANTDIAYDFTGGGAVQTITKGQGETQITYDFMFRPVLERTKDLSTGWQSYVNTKYDPMGRATFTSQPSASPTEAKGIATSYDGLGRVRAVADTSAGIATKTYRYLSSHRTKVFDAEYNFKLYYARGYDGPGSKDYSRIYEYGRDERTYLRKTYLDKNIWGQILHVRQWGPLGGNQYQYYSYDDRQRLCRYYTPEHEAALYEYDIAGQMIAYAKGQTGHTGCAAVPNTDDRVELEYDDLGRLITTDFADANTPDIARTYDDNGNLLTLNRGSGMNAVNWAYSYLDNDALNEETLSIDGRDYKMTYSYNPSEAMQSQVLPTNRRIDHAPDGLGRATQARWAAGDISYASHISYHRDGSLYRLRYGNGKYLTRVVNNRLLPSRLLVSVGGSRMDFIYSYDDMGRVITVTDNKDESNNRSYGYDGLGQLTTSTGPWGMGSYRYDSLGNILSKTEGFRELTLTYDSRNRLQSSADTGATGTRDIAYDTRGNVTALGALTMTYDLSDQPVSLSGTASGTGEASGHYRYDGNLRRVKSVVNGKIIYNIYNAAGQLVHIDEASRGKRTDYIMAAGQTVARAEGTLAADPVTYMHSDHLGSASVATNSAGHQLWTERYSPFGETLLSAAANDNQAGFTGHIKDAATGLNYMQARYYDPVIGRFLSIDPVQFDGTNNPGLFNRYSYAYNNPINLIDPDGRQACGTEESSCAETAASAATAVTAREGMGAQNARNNYNNTVSGLDANDSAGRSAAKAAARADTPPITRGMIEATRPSTGAQPGTGGTANRTNAGATKVANTLGTVGKTNAVANAVINGTRIAGAENPVQETAVVGAGIGGALAGSKYGAGAGGLATKHPGGVLAGGVVGGLVGGFAGEGAVRGALEGGTPCSTCGAHRDERAGPHR